MAGPVIRPVTPEWLKPQNASVFDSPLVQFMQALINGNPAPKALEPYLPNLNPLSIITDPSEQVMSVANPMAPVAISLVPRKSTEELMRRFTSRSSPDAFRQVVEYMVNKYPRLMGHIAYIDPHANLNPEDAIASASDRLTPITMGRHIEMGPSKTAKQIQRGIRDVTPTPISEIKIDGRAVKSKQDYVKTLSHEMTHVAQNLRQTDRAIRDYDAPTFMEDYVNVHNRAGYQRNPYERAARETAEVQKKRYGMARLVKLYTKAGRSPVEVYDLVKEAFPSATRLELQGAFAGMGKLAADDVTGK